MSLPKLAIVKGGPLPEKEQQSRARWLTLREVIKLRSSGQPMLIEGLLPGQGLAMVSGTSGVGKSWFLAALAHSIAVSGRFMDRFPTELGEVRFVGRDGSETDYAGQVERAFGKNPSWPKGLTTDDSPIAWSFGEWASMNTDNDARECLAAINEKPFLATGPRVIMFDALEQLHEQNEISPDDMKLVMRRFRDLATHLDALVIVAHHHAKAGEKGPKAGNDRVRGTTAIVNALDANLSLSTDKAGLTSLVVAKGRFARAKDFKYRLNVTPTSVTLSYEEAVTTEAIKTSILDLIRKHGEKGTKIGTLIKQVEGTALAGGKKGNALRCSLGRQIKPLIEAGKLVRGERGIILAPGKAPEMIPAKA